MRHAKLGVCVIAFLFCAQSLCAEVAQQKEEEDKASSAKASASESTPLAIPGKKAVELLAQPVTLTNPKGAVLVLATVQLVYASVPTDKMVVVSVARDHVVLEAFSVRIGTSPGAVSELPVTVHAWDSPGDGPHTYSVVATSNQRGVKATARRLTVAEIP